MATVERMLMPMGEASIRFARWIPSAVMLLTGKGSFSPAQWAERPGIRLSSTMVVLPEPETPVTAVSLPFGISTVSSWTVWIDAVSIRIVPSWNISAESAHSRIFMALVSVKNGAIFESWDLETSAILPCAKIVPPLVPASGPSSIMWSAHFRTRTS